MKNNILSFLLVASAVMLTVSSCIKDDIQDLGTAGTARVKLLEAPKRALFFSPFTDVRNIDVFSLRRDEVSAAGINEAITVKVMADPAGVDAYNEENHTTYEALPDSLYTVVGEGVTKSGNEISMTLASKSIGNELQIAMDGSKWDVSHKYAMMYRIVDSASHGITQGKASVFVTIEAKNQWDGIYEVTGTFTDLFNSPFAAVYPYTWELQTLSPTQCLVVDNILLGGAGFVFSVDGTPTALSYYGSFGLVVTFNPETNEIADLQNYYGQPSANTRSAILDPTGINMYDPETKTINIKYYMTQPSYVVDPPHIRARWEEEWRYIGPRE